MWRELVSGATYLPWQAPGLTRFSAGSRGEGLNLYSSLTLRGSIATLWSGVNRSAAKLQDSVHDGRCGRTHVERVELAAHRQCDELVARVAHARAQPSPLGTEHHHDPPAIVGAVVWDRGLRARSVDPRARLLGAREVVREVANPR